MSGAAFPRQAGRSCPPADVPAGAELEAAMLPCPHLHSERTFPALRCAPFAAFAGQGEDKSPFCDQVFRNLEGLRLEWVFSPALSHLLRGELILTDNPSVQSGRCSSEFCLT